MCAWQLTLGMAAYESAKRASHKHVITVGAVQGKTQETGEDHVVDRQRQHLRLVLQFKWMKDITVMPWQREREKAFAGSHCLGDLCHTYQHTRTCALTNTRTHGLATNHLQDPYMSRPSAGITTPYGSREEILVEEEEGGEGGMAWLTEEESVIGDGVADRGGECDWW